MITIIGVDATSYGLKSVAVHMSGQDWDRILKLCNDEPTRERNTHLVGASVKTDTLAKVTEGMWALGMLQREIDDAIKRLEAVQEAIQAVVKREMPA